MKTRLAAIAFAALGALAGPGCKVDNRASIQPQAICAPTKDCTFKSTCDAQYIGYPTLDVAAGSDLWLFIQVANQLPNNQNLDIGKTNTNDAHIDEAYVEYEGAITGSTTQAIGSIFSVPASGSSVISLDLNLQNAAPGEIVAHVRLRGFYDDGTRFEAGEFPITIQVCSGCVGIPACAKGSCPGLPGMLPYTCLE